MAEYIVNVNFVKEGQDYFAGDKVDLDEKVATDMIAQGKKEHPTLGDFLSPVKKKEKADIAEEKPKKKKKTEGA